MDNKWECVFFLIFRLDKIDLKKNKSRYNKERTDKIKSCKTVKEKKQT